MAEFETPAHHVHSADEPLPGSKGAAATQDYSASTIDHAPNAALDTTTSTSDNATSVASAPDASAPPELSEGGVTGGEEHPKKVGIADKLVGKTQATIGKATHNTDKVEAGQVRATEGKNA